MSDEMDRVSDELADARLEFAIAEANLAAARADLTRAERQFHKIWGAALAKAKGDAPHPAEPREGV